MNRQCSEHFSYNSHNIMTVSMFSIKIQELLVDLNPVLA